MSAALDRIAFRWAVAAWLRFSPASWTRLPIASDSPHVHAPGTNPDRILVTGDGACAGYGVATHELSLPGYLARSLSAITGRATDVDIMVTGNMTARKSLAAIDSVDLRRFDAIVLSVGAIEALAFRSVKQWRTDLELLLDRVDRNAAPTTITFTLAIPLFTAHRLFPTVLAQACDRHAARLNRATQELIATRATARYSELIATGPVALPTPHLYERWATSVAPDIAAELGIGTGNNPRDQAMVEAERQAALDNLNVLEADLRRDPVFSDLTARAREVFGTAFAAITLIDRHRQQITASSGLPTHDMARNESFCDVTIQRESHLAVEDTLLDPRYKDLRIVNTGPRVRFYAGYPIESPDGQRIGAMCVLDTAPRHFSEQDAVLLRLLAQETQKRLWDLSAGINESRQNAANEPHDTVAEFSMESRMRRLLIGREQSTSG